MGSVPFSRRRLLLHDLDATDGDVADGAVVVDLQPLRDALGPVALNERVCALLTGRQDDEALRLPEQDATMKPMSR
jgi:hypothetical protein